MFPGGHVAILLVERYLEFAGQPANRFRVLDRGELGGLERGRPWGTMFDAGSPSDPLLQPRALGEGVFRAEHRAGRSVIAAMRHQGSAKIMVPRTAGDAFEAVLVNTAGGLTGGDRFRWLLEAGSHVDLTVTTQAAERAYRAPAGMAAEARTELRLGPGATLHWLPQETILFDRSALDRRLEVEMADDAVLLASEAVLFGRLSMGEHLRAFRFADRWRIRRGGRLIYADALRFADASPLSEPACLNGNAAMASIVMTAPDAADRLEGARTLLEAEPAVEAGASAFDGLLAVRMVAPDGYRLRPALVRLLTHLRRRPLPRVWIL